MGGTDLRELFANAAREVVGPGTRTTRVDLNHCQAVGNSAVTWSAGISVAGLGLSTKTGMSTQARVDYWFDDKSQMCGDTADWPSAKRIAAVNRK